MELATPLSLTSIIKQPLNCIASPMRQCSSAGGNSDFKVSHKYNETGASRMRRTGHIV